MGNKPWKVGPVANANTCFKSVCVWLRFVSARIPAFRLTPFPRTIISEYGSFPPPGPNVWSNQDRTLGKYPYLGSVQGS